VSKLYEKTYTIRATKGALHKFETFLAFMHYNGGHTGLFAMPFDGDGWDVLKVDPAPPEDLREPAQGTASVGADVEIAYAGRTGVAFIDWSRTRKWEERVSAVSASASYTSLAN